MKRFNFPANSQARQWNAPRGKSTLIAANSIKLELSMRENHQARVNWVQICSTGNSPGENLTTVHTGISFLITYGAKSGGAYHSSGCFSISAQAYSGEQCNKPTKCTTILQKFPCKQTIIQHHDQLADSLCMEY
jgi:hypothetical protein